MAIQKKPYAILGGIAALAVIAAACGGGGGPVSSQAGNSTTAPAAFPTPSEGTVLLQEKGTQLEEGPKVGKLAPSFTLSTPGGKAVSLSDFRGKPVLVNFWATWCGPCKVEMPHLQSIHEELSPQGLTVLAVDLDESSDAVVSYFKDLGLTFTPVIDKGLKVAQGKYGVFGLPSTYFVDRDGVIRFIKIGPFVTRQSLRDQIRTHFGM